MTAPDRPIVTRFAPSPTGDLHIGGARTALFNWLFAHGQGGKFLLRIEDTDRARSTQSAIEAILAGLGWLGLTPDEPPIFQFARAGRHREVAEALIARGGAFRCYVSQAELEARREAGEAARTVLREARAQGASAGDLAALTQTSEALTGAFRSPYRSGDLSPPTPGAPFVVRLKAPDSGDIVNPDLIQGEVRVAAADIDDLVLLRADGTPTYMLAVAVDDHDMAITHVLRGDDHLTNAARQIPIFQAMGWPVPHYGHIPLIHGPDGQKLSKRHGAQGVEAYREMGYLPEAVLNYLARLGWSHGNEEIFSLEDAARWFQPEDVNKGPSRLDFDKLNFLNGHYIKQADDDRLFALLQNLTAPDAAWRGEAELVARVKAAVPILKARAKTVVELLGLTAFLTAVRPLPMTETARAALDPPDVCPRLQRLAEGPLRGLDAWTEPALAEALKAFAAGEGVGMGKIGPGVRAALTGGSPAPDLSAILALLGKAEALGRLSDACAATR